jgi:hypothetical protein
LVTTIKQAHPEWQVTAYARGNRPTEELRIALGADRVVTGDFSEYEKIKALSAEHEIVVNAGNSFTNEPVRAIADGLHQRPAESKGKLIHISGTGYSHEPCSLRRAKVLI